MDVHYNRVLNYLTTVLLTILLLPLLAHGLPGDLNGSGRVDGYDLIIFGQAYGSTPADDSWNPDADLNRDGVVDDKDLNILSAHFGKNGISFGLWVGAASGTNKLFKLSSTGNLLQQLTGFSHPVSISGNFNDNTVWVADSSANKVIQLSGFDGETNVVVTGMTPNSVSVDQRDGAVWVADYNSNRVVKLLSGITDGYDISQDTGSHLVISGFNRPRSISVNPVTGTVWVADGSGNRVVRLDPNVPDGYNIGSDLGSHTTKSGFSNPYSVSVNSTDGTAWVADYGNNQVVKLSATGTTELARISGFYQPMSVSTSSVDGSVWIADYRNNQVVRLAADGSLVCRVDGFSNPYAVSVNPLDGSAWVADYNSNQIVLLSPNGTEQMRISGITRPQTVSVIADHGTAGRYPVATATLNKNHVAVDETIEFIGTGNDPDGTIRLYEWDFDGDGTFDFRSTTSGITTHDFGEIGLYNPVFRVTDNDWLTATDYTQIVRVGELKATATADVMSGPAPLTVNFEGSFVDPIDGFVESFQWDFDGDNIFDHFSETTPDVTHTFSRAGEYTVIFKVTDGPHAALDQMTINVAPAHPEVTASATPTVGPLPLKVNFSGSASDPDGEIMLYEWDFEGDGTFVPLSTSSPDIFYIYDIKGLYTATLRVTDNDGNTSTATVEIDAGTTDTPFVAVADADKTAGRSPVTIHFNADGSSGDDIVKYEWNFGDGSLFSDSMDSDSGKWVADENSWQLVQTEYHSRPSAWANSPDGNYPDGADHSLTSIPIDLSDVSTATLSFQHRYETERYRDYCLVEISTNGGSSWNQLRNYHGTLAAWTRDVINISGYLPNSDIRIRFRFTSNDNTNFDGWYIDDVRIHSDETDWIASTDGNASHTYDQSGLFEAQLRITDANDFQKTDTIDILVDPSFFPEVTAIADPKTGDTPLTVTFTGSAAGSDGATIEKYAWNFGEDYVWVADQSNNQVVRLCQDGTCEMARTGGVNSPYDVSISPVDGTVWVADYNNNAVVRFSANGQTELVRVGGFSRPQGVCVNTTDGSVWVADTFNNQVVNLASDGKELVRAGGFNRPQDVAVNAADGTVWVADTNIHQVVKLSAGGSGLVRISGFNFPLNVAVNHVTGTIWVANTTADTIVRLAPDVRDGYHIGKHTGSHLEFDGFNDPYSVSVDITDDSVWIADYLKNAVVHLSSDGTELSRTIGFNRPTGVAVNAAGDNIWVADYNNNQVAMLSGSGRVLTRLSGFNRPRAVAVADTGDSNVFTSETSGTTTHTYTKPGIYHAVFTATDNDGNAVSRSVDIAVLGAPSVSAKANITSGPAPLEVFFIADVVELSGRVIKYEWAFDKDGVVFKDEHISGQSPEIRHIFPEAGIYKATIRVTTDLGYVSTDSVFITVEKAPPSAHAAAAPVRGNVPLTVNFNGSGTDPDGSIVKYEWNFDGDGTGTFADSGPDTSFEYTQAGTYTARLRVTDNDGLTGTDSLTIIVSEASTPSAILYIPSETSGYAPYNSRFYVHGIDPDGTIDKVEIDYTGDGTFKTIQPTAFGDNMETGDQYWTAEGTWARTPTDAYSPSWSWTDSPDGNYPDNADMSLISITIDLSSATAPKLTFWNKYEFKSYDYGYIYISGDDGKNWTQLRRNSGTQSDWVKEEFDLSSYAGNPTVKIRFRLTSNASDNADGWYIDDVWVGDMIEHTYTAHGNYSVTLRVTDNLGNTSVTTRDISVVAPENAAGIWVADHYNNRVVKLSDMGDILVRVNGFNRPRALEVNPSTGNVWVADTNNNRIIKLPHDVPDEYNVSRLYTFDASTTNNTGTLYGDTTLAETGKLNQGFYFDGSGDYIQIPDNPAYRMDSWTLEAWIKPDNLSGNRTVVGKVSQYKDFALMMTGDKISVLVYDGARRYITAGDTLTMGQWYHVAGVFDPSSGMVRLYVDGVLKQQAEWTPDTSNTDSLMIGRSNSGSEQFLGTIDDVRVWNMARSETQIADARNSELAGNEPGLVGYWKLNTISTPYHQTMSGFNFPYGLSVNTADNSVWVADRSNNQVVHLDSDGVQIKRIPGFRSPSDIAVNPSDGSVWVSDTSNHRIVKLLPDVFDGFLLNTTGITTDSTSNANTGMLMGDVAPDTGKLNGSLWFDGNGDYIVMLPDPSLDVQDFTLEAWIKGNNVTDRALFMRGNNAGEDELYFGFKDATTVQAILDNENSVLFTGDIDFTDGEWRHIALVYDSSLLTCYVDGVVYGTPAAMNVTLNFEDSQALIGADFDRFNSYLGNYFNGHIDDVRLWNTARTLEQINENKDAELTGAEAGLAGYWQLNDVSDAHRIVSGFSSPYGLSIDRSDNGAWVADHNNNQVVKLAEDGSQIHRKSGYNRPYRLAVNPNDRTVWVGDYLNGRMVKLRPDGEEIAWIWGFNYPHGVAVNPDDATVWVTDERNNQVVKLSPDGTELLRIGGFNYPFAVSIDPATRNLSNPPHAAAGATPADDGEIPLEVVFTGTGEDDGSIVEYAWDFNGDGIFDYISTTSGNTTHTYTTAGTYTPVLRVTDNDGQIAYTSPGIIYAGPLTVRASASATSGNAPLTVTLTGYITGLGPGRAIVEYEWDVDGDGIFDYTSKTSPATSHKYSTGGDYRASIRVTDDLGNQAYDSVDIQVSKQAPTAQNYATPTSGNAPLKVYLDGRGSDSDGSIIRYEWDYDGDGIYDWFSTDTGRTYFTYKTPGTYEATLRVTDNDNLTAVAAKTITVTQSDNPPMANASASVTRGEAPLQVDFTGTGTDTDGQIQLYEWDFEGTGTYEHNSTETGTAAHTFTTPGVYRSVFRVTDADGLTATSELVITVTETGTPTAVANASPKTGATPLTVHFNAMGSHDPDGSIVRYEWSFGADDLLWVADYNNNRVKQVKGSQSDNLPMSFNRPYRLSVNPDGTVWISDHVNNQIVKISADGQHEIVRASGFNRPYGVCADPADGGVWVADYNSHQVVKLNADGSEHIRKNGFRNPTSVAVYHEDGSVWVTDYNNNQIVKLDSDGSELFRISGFNRPFWVTVDPSDGNIWVADRYNHRVVKMAANPPAGYHTGVALVTPETGSGNHAMLFGDAAPADAGKLSGAVTLDGSGDYVLIPSDAFSDMDSFTVEAWIKPSSTYRAIFTRGNEEGKEEIYFGLYSNSILEVTIDESARQRFSGSLNFTDGNWHHVAITYDGTNQKLSCYADGALYGEPVTVPADSKAHINFGGAHALIGARFNSFNASPGTYFNGQIDDVRVWNVVRTSEQINGNKDEALTGSESGLAGYWKLDEFLPTPYHKIRTGFNEPLHVAVNPKDNTAWVCDHRNNQMVRISSDGTREIFRVAGFNRPHEAVISPVNGTVWVADYLNNQVVQLTDSGREIQRISGFNQPTSVALAPVDPNSLISLETDQTISRIYPNIGEHIASLTVTDDEGKTDTDTVAVKAGTFPEALAIAYPTTGTAPLTVRFAANGHSPTGTIEYFRWNFGDGSSTWVTRISENREYTYTQPGIYTATLTVEDNRGYTDVKEVLITVLAPSIAPEVVIVADPKEGKSPLNVTFTGLARDSDGTITKFEWDFDGDGTFDFSSTESASASHTYTDIGTYTVKLRVTDNDGNQGTGITRIKVKPTGAPSATAGASVTHGTAALAVTFTGSGGDLDTIVNYEWDFDGDGTFDFSSVESASAAHVYTLPGSYTAVLRITNEKGLTDTASVDILVTAGITASLSRESFDPYVGETIAIQSVMTARAAITILITDRTGTTIRTLVENADRTPGFYSDTWDGKNDIGQFMDSGAYLYVIHYETGGKKYVYDLTNDISAGIDKITPEYPAAFNPFNADTNFFRYTLDRKSEITVYISPFDQRTLAHNRIKTMLLRHPQKAGSYVLVWDGTDDNGNLVTAMSYVLAVFKWHLPDNAIIVNTRPIISDPLIKPAYLNPDARPYDPENQSVMTYTLSKKADVTFSIYDSLNYIVRTITMKDVPAGAGNTVIWDGKNAAGKYVTPGTYRTKLVATDANGNKSFDANALLIVFY